MSILASSRFAPACLGGLVALAWLPGCLVCEGPPELLIDLDDAVVPASMDLRGIVRTDSGHLVVGTGGAIVRRPRYSDWTAIESPTTADLLGVDQWGSRMIAVGRSGAAVRSEDDGLSFEVLDLGVLEDLHAVWLDSQRGVIVGDEQILWSNDGGQSFAPASFPSGAALRGVAAADDTLWAVGLAGTLLRSDDDGASWAAVDSPVGADLWAIGWAGIDVEVGLHAVGDDGTILRLEDGAWRTIDHDLDGDFRDVRGNSIVGLGGLVVAIEIDDGQRYFELGRDPTRGDLHAVIDGLAVGDKSRITTISIDWVERRSASFCR